MPSALPPDRGHIRTEKRHEASIDLDTLSVAQCVNLMIEDHRAAREAAAGAAGALSALIEDIVPRLRGGGRIVYLGAGTSGRLGVLDAAECPPTFQVDPRQVVGVIAGGDTSLRKSSEAMEDDPRGAAAALNELNLGVNDSLIGIAAGGTTPYVLGAVSLAKARGSLTALLTCAALTGPPHGCDHLIFLDTGPELLTGSTRLKAGSATKLALNIISTTAFIRLGKVYSNLMVDLRATNAKLRDRAIRILVELCPELSRDAAAGALEAAGGDLKAAIVMQRLDLELDAAQVLLAAHDRHLRAALEDTVP